MTSDAMWLYTMSKGTQSHCDWGRDMNILSQRRAQHIGTVHETRRVNIVKRKNGARALPGTYLLPVMRIKIGSQAKIICYLSVNLLAVSARRPVRTRGLWVGTQYCDAK